MCVNHEEECAQEGASDTDTVDKYPTLSTVSPDRATIQKHDRDACESEEQADDLKSERPLAKEGPANEHGPDAAKGAADVSMGLDNVLGAEVQAPVPAKMQKGSNQEEEDCLQIHFLENLGEVVGGDHCFNEGRHECVEEGEGVTPRVLDPGRLWRNFVRSSTDQAATDDTGKKEDKLN